MNENFEGKVVLISGASRGLGRSLALGFGRTGATLALFARNQAAIGSLADELTAIGATFVADALDLRDEASVISFVDKILQRFDHIDVLVNNASIVGPRFPIVTYPTASWREVIDINLTGTFILTKHVVPGMIDRGRGSIINLSSGVGRRPSRLWGAYAASKHALEGFTANLAEELKSIGVRVNSVDPGPMATEMRRLAYPSEDPAALKQPDDILKVFYYLASDKSQHITGQKFNAQDFRRD